MFQMNYALGLVAFWYMRGWQSTIVWILNRLFSGRYIPLWFSRLFLSRSRISTAPVNVLCADIYLSGHNGAA